MTATDRAKELAQVAAQAAADKKAAAEKKELADQAAAELRKRGATPPKLRAVSDDELEAIFRK